MLIIVLIYRYKAKLNQYFYILIQKGELALTKVIKKISTAIIVMIFIVSFTISASAASAVSGLPLSLTMHVGETVTWNPNPSGGEWTFDSQYLSFNKSGSLATVTALKEGDTKVEYTLGVDNDPAVINVSILPKGGVAAEVSSSQTSVSDISSSQVSSEASSSAASSNTQSDTSDVSSDVSSDASSKVLNPAAGHSSVLVVIIAAVSVLAIIISFWNKKFLKG